MGIHSGHNPKLPPLATPKVGGEKNSTLQNHVQFMKIKRNTCLWAILLIDKNYPRYPPPKLGLKKSTLQKRVKLMRNEEKGLLFKPFC